jgi:hypothetical protein
MECPRSAVGERSSKQNMGQKAPHEILFDGNDQQESISKSARFIN